MSTFVHILYNDYWYNSSSLLHYGSGCSICSFCLRCSLIFMQSLIKSIKTSAPLAAWMKGCYKRMIRGILAGILWLLQTYCEQVCYILPFCRVLGEAFGQEIKECGWPAPGVGQGRGREVGDGCYAIYIPHTPWWGPPLCQLNEGDAQGPHVSLAVIGVLQDDLGGHPQRTGGVLVGGMRSRQGEFILTCQSRHQIALWLLEAAERPQNQL